MQIYQPAEDSYLLQETLKQYLKPKPKNIKILDMGSGSGIQAKTCKDLGFKNITTADINPNAIKLLEKEKLNPILSNLFTEFSSSTNFSPSSESTTQKFDLIIFNPPYLPKDEREPEDSRQNTTAGEKGYEIILEFLEQAKSHLTKDGEILLLISSLSQPNVIEQKARELNYKFKILNETKLAFEKLFVYKISKLSKN